MSVALQRVAATSRFLGLGAGLLVSELRESVASLVEFGGGSRFYYVVSLRYHHISLSVRSSIEVTRGPRDTFGKMQVS